MKPLSSSNSGLVLVEVSKALLESQKEVWIPLKGNCMWPVVKDGDLLKIEKIAYPALRFADVAIFQTGSETFHANTLFCNAQRNAPENYLGKVTEVNRRGKFVNLEGRSFLLRFCQAVISPANPYGLNLPKTLWQKIRRGKP